MQTRIGQIAFWQCLNITEKAACVDSVYYFKKSPKPGWNIVLNTPFSSKFWRANQAILSIKIQTYK